MIKIIVKIAWQVNTVHPELVEGRGMMSVAWSGTDNSNKPVSSGIYFYKMKAGNHEITKKMILLK